MDTTSDTLTPTSPSAAYIEHLPVVAGEEAARIYTLEEEIGRLKMINEHVIASIQKKVRAAWGCVHGCVRGKGHALMMDDVKQAIMSCAMCMTCDRMPPSVPSTKRLIVSSPNSQRKSIR